MPSLTIRLPERAAAALQDLAQIECRSPRDQAAFLILEGLRAASAIGHFERGSPDGSTGPRVEPLVADEAFDTTRREAAAAAAERTWQNRNEGDR